MTRSMPNYDLYTELGLDKDMPPVEIGALLDGKINGLLGRGFQRNSPEVDQLSTARAILSDPTKRNTYEAALQGPDGIIDVTWLHNLADSPSTPAPVSQPDQQASASALLQSPNGSYDSYDSSATSVIGAHSSERRDASSDNAVDAGPASQSPSLNSSQSPYGAPFGDSPYGQHSTGYNQQGQQGQQGQQNYAPAGAFGGKFNQGFQAAPASPASSSPQFSASLSVAGRERSESKVYLGCLAVMVLGMIYPLIVLFTDDGFDDGVFKGILFAIAHTVVWAGLAEISWGVRRIAAPAEPESSKTPADSQLTGQAS